MTSTKEVWKIWVVIDLHTWIIFFSFKTMFLTHSSEITKFHFTRNLKPEVTLVLQRSKLKEVEVAQTLLKENEVSLCLHSLYILF